MLTLKNVSKTFDKSVLNNFSYAFPETGLFVVRGESGAGKTTLLRLIAGLIKPDCGEICLKEDVKISMVFQEARLVPYLTLIENLLLVRKNNDTQKAKEILASLSLADDADKYPSELSGGMKLRGAIARSLYYGGNLYLWDEPTKELDEENQKKVIDILQNLAKEHLVIVVTHDDKIFGGTEILV